MANSTTNNGNKVKKSAANKNLANRSSKYYTTYEGKATLFVVALKEHNIPSSLEYRKKIAKKNGIHFYFGWGSQNKKLFDLFKKGKLIKP